MCYSLNVIYLAIEIITSNNGYQEKSIKIENASQTEKHLIKSLSRREFLFSAFAKNWILFMCLIMPTHNLIVIVFWNIKEFLLKKILCFDSLKLIELNNYFYMFFVITQSSYFATGNSNSLNTVHISSGLVGINFINEPLIAFLLLSATYSSHVYWFLVQNQILMREELKFNIKHLKDREASKVFKNKKYVQSFSF